MKLSIQRQRNSICKKDNQPALNTINEENRQPTDRSAGKSVPAMECRNVGAKKKERGRIRRRKKKERNDIKNSLK